MRVRGVRVRIGVRVSQDRVRGHGFESVPYFYYNFFCLVLCTSTYSSTVEDPVHKVWETI